MYPMIWYFIDFVSKAFPSIIKKYFILYNDVYTMIPECLSRILSQKWEELTTQVINLSHFVPPSCSQTHCKIY